jgi:hypothetical protein
MKILINKIILILTTINNKVTIVITKIIIIIKIILLITKLSLRTLLLLILINKVICFTEQTSLAYLQISSMIIVINLDKKMILCSLQLVKCSTCLLLAT